MASNAAAVYEFTQAHIFPRSVFLTAEQERELWARWHETGSQRARDRIITAHMPLCAKKAASWAKTNTVDPNDLYGAGLEAITKAFDKFDPEKGTRFSTLSGWYIDAAIREHINNFAGSTRMTTTVWGKYLYSHWSELNRDAAQGQSDMTNGERHQRIAELVNARCESTSIEARDVEAFESRLAGTMSLDMRITEDGGTLQDMFADAAPLQDEILEQRDELEKRGLCLREAFAKLNPREQEIVQGRYLDEDKKTLEDLSTVFNVSRERIRQIEVKAMEKLKGHMLPLMRQLERHEP